MDVSENSGTPKSSILIGFSIINHTFWGTPIFGNTHMSFPDKTLTLYHQYLTIQIFILRARRYAEALGLKWKKNQK